MRRAGKHPRLWVLWLLWLKNSPIFAYTLTHTLTGKHRRQMGAPWRKGPALLPVLSRLDYTFLLCAEAFVASLARGGREHDYV